jgi:protein phosphatase
MTQKGVGKAENEDRIVVGKTILANGIFQYCGFEGLIAIADGVGGNNAGAVAAHFVANRVGELKCIDKESLNAINEDLIETSNGDMGLRNMATTLSGLFCQDSTCTIFHIGNTRIYALQGGRYLKQITEDDTTVNYLLRTGQLSPDDAQTSANKGEITACFGAGDAKLFDIKISTIPDANTFLLTSDGVHDYVSLDELENSLQNYDNPVHICWQIAENATANGSHDDISILIVEIVEEGNEA